MVGENAEQGGGDQKSRVSKGGDGDSSDRSCGKFPHSIREDAGRAVVLIREGTRG